MTGHEPPLFCCVRVVGLRSPVMSSSATVTPASVSSVSSFNGLHICFSANVVVVLEVPADPLALLAAVVLTLAHGASTNRWLLAHHTRGRDGDRGFHLRPNEGAHFMSVTREENDGTGQFSFIFFRSPRGRHRISHDLDEERTLSDGVRVSACEPWASGQCVAGLA